MARKAEISINLDTKCSRCGAKGAAQNGLCLKCAGDDIVNKLKREVSMAEVNVKVQTEKMEVKSKIVEEKGEGGVVVDRHIITEVKVEYEGTPGKLDDILYTLRSGHDVDVTFSSPQLSLGLDESERKKKEPAEVTS